MHRQVLRTGGVRPPAEGAHEVALLEVSASAPEEEEGGSRRPRGPGGDQRSRHAAGTIVNEGHDSQTVLFVISSH